MLRFETITFVSEKTGCIVQAHGGGHKHDRAVSLRLKALKHANSHGNDTAMCTRTVFTLRRASPRFGGQLDTKQFDTSATGVAFIQHQPEAG